MTATPLSAQELESIRSVFRRHPAVKSAILFGSRAKGTHNNRSDVDLVVSGLVMQLEAEAIASDLDELATPYHFDVQSMEHIQHRGLLDHIQRVGIVIYRAA